MGMKDRLAESVRANAARAKVAKKGKKKPGPGLPSTTGHPQYVPPHMHCKICQVTVGMGRDPPVCDDADCVKEWDDRERQRRRISWLPWIALGVVAISFVLPMVISKT
jgi:predicted nucleic acid-binding Zn ribbon protein